MMKKTILILWLTGICLMANAGLLFQTDFNSHIGTGWKDGVYYNMEDVLWKMNGSALSSGAGTVRVNSSGFLEISGCRGDLLLFLPEISAGEWENITAKVEWDHASSGTTRKIKMKNMEGNSFSLVEDMPGDVSITTNFIIVNHTIFASLYFHNLNPEAAFLLREITLSGHLPESVLTGHKVVNKEGVILLFSSLHTENSFENISLKCNGKLRSYDSIVPYGDNSLKIFFPVVPGEYELAIGGLKDMNGESVRDTTISFISLASVHHGDIVINEIMFKPSDKLGLPKVEYLELYNLTSRPLILDSIAFIDRGKIKDYLYDTIYPQDYLLLAGTSASLLQEFGRVKRVKSFTLVDDSATIILRSKTGEMIDSLQYKHDWIRERKKYTSGGYSLERIDPQLYSDDVRNWHESLDPSGGTPGRINSVYKNCPDNIPPYIEDIVIADSVRIIFNENLFSTGDDLTCFMTEPLREPIACFLSDRNVVCLCFKVQKGVSYKVTLQGVTDLCGNRMPDKEISLFIGEDAQPGDILINELLYDAIPNEAEYIELINVSNKTINLQNLNIAKRNSQGEITAKKDITETGNVIGPGELIWICSRPELIKETFRYHREDNCYVIQSNSSYYNNSGGKIVVVTDQGSVIDELIYDGTFHNPAVKIKKGIAIERTDIFAPTSDAASWTSAGGDAVEGHGSPGMPNRATKQISGAQLSSGYALLPEPEVFTPDGDGIEDVLNIVIDAPMEEYTVNIQVVNSSGKIVNTIARGQPVYGRNVFKWDGTGHSGNLLSAGIYIISAEIIKADGFFQHLRKACVLSR